jgi:hypothetical protein
VSGKDDDAGLLTQVKEEDAARRKIDRKDKLLFEWFDYLCTTKVLPKFLLSQ